MDIRGTQLHPDTVFHIFNRGINGAPVFYEEKNYNYFLQQYARYVYPFVETFAYCLLGNHFHLLIRVLSEDAIASATNSNKEKPCYWHVSNAFSSFLQSYTRAINKMYERTGPLFESPFKRIPVTEEAYFSKLVTYIHQNPSKHGLTDDYRDYPHSSYHAYLFEQRNTKLNRAEVLEWFGGEKEFTQFHDDQYRQTKLSLDESWLLE